MRRESRQRFLPSCITARASGTWSMSRSLTLNRGSVENVPGVPDIAQPAVLRPCGQMADYIISADELGHNSTWTLQWRHNGRDAVSNHQPHHCLLNRLSRHRSKKTSKLRATAFVRGIHRSPVNSPHKWPVTRKMFPFDEVIMVSKITE